MRVEHIDKAGHRVLFCSLSLLFVLYTSLIIDYCQAQNINVDTKISENQWLPINRGFPNSISAPNQKLIERFFYKHGKVNQKFVLTDQFKEELLQNDKNLFNIHFSMKFWQNDVVCQKSVTIFPKREVDGGTNLNWTPYQSIFSTSKEIDDFQDFYVWLFVSDGCENAMMAFKDIKLKYSKYLIGGNDSKVVIPESKFKQLKLAEMPANDHPTSTAVYCYSSCSIDITKLAKGKFDFSGWSKSTSCDVSLLLDGKKVGADHKIEDPSKFIDFSEDTTNWELTDNSIITMNVNCPENVVIRLNVPEVKFSDLQVFNGFVGETKENQFIISSSKKQQFALYNGTELETLLLMKNTETSETFDCFKITYCMDNTDENSAFNLTMLVGNEYNNQYRLRQWKPNTGEQIDICLSDFYYKFSKKDFQILLDAHNLNSKAKPVLISFETIAPPTPPNPPQKSPSESEAEETKTINYINNSPDTNVWSTLIPGNLVVEAQKFAKLHVDNTLKKYQLSTVWINYKDNLNLIKTPVRINFIIDDPKTDEVLSNEIFENMHLNAQICDQIMDCIPVGDITKLSVDKLTENSFKVLYEITLEPHPNIESETIKMDLHLSFAPISNELSPLIVKAEIENFGNPCYQNKNCPDGDEKKVCLDEPSKAKANDFENVCKCKEDFIDKDCTQKDFCKTASCDGNQCHNGRQNFECIHDGSKDQTLKFWKEDKFEDGKKATFAKKDDIGTWQFEIPKTDNDQYKYDYCVHFVPTKTDSIINFVLKLDSKDKSFALTENKIATGYEIDICLSQFLDLYSIIDVGTKIVVEVNDPKVEESWTKVYNKPSGIKEKILIPLKAFDSLVSVPKQLKTTVMNEKNELEIGFSSSSPVSQSLKFTIFSGWFENQGKFGHETEKIVISASDSYMSFTLRLCGERKLGEKDCVTIGSSNGNNLELTNKVIDSALQRIDSSFVQFVFDIDIVKTIERPVVYKAQIKFSLWNLCESADNICNKGVCSPVSASSVHCDCSKTGFTGDHCQIDESNCKNEDKELCAKHDGVCVPELDGFTCTCPIGYQYNKEAQGCLQTTLTHVEKTCKVSSDSEFECFLDGIPQIMTYLPKYYPKITSKDNPLSNHYFSITSQNHLKITVTLNPELKKSTDYDACFSFKYFVAPGAKLRLLFNDEVELLHLNGIEILNEEADFDVQLSPEQTVCLKHYIDVDLLNEIKSLTFVSENTNADSSAFVQILQKTNNQFLSIKSVDVTLSKTMFKYISITTDQQKDVPEEVKNSLQYQWPMMFPNGWKVVDERKLSFSRMSKNIKDFAYLESHWLTRKIRGLNSNVKLRFKIKVLNGEEPIESVTAYLINTKRAQIGTIAKYSKLYLIENNYAIDESVNLRIDESFKLVIMFEHVNSKSDTTPLFEIEDISFGDPCNNPCYGLDKKIDETIKCERLVLEDDEMDFKCNCDEANGLFGKTCQKINYCLYKHLENEKNPDSKINGNEYCKPKGECHPEGQFGDYKFLCTCIDDKSQYFDLEKRECLPISQCLVNPCDLETQDCKYNGTSTRECVCKEGYQVKKDSSASCEKMNPCEKNPCLDENMQCIASKNFDHYTCKCQRGFKLEGDKCVSNFCSFPGRHDCDQYCKNIETMPYYQCSCEATNYDLVPKGENNTLSECKLKSTAPEECKKCTNKYQICVKGKCQCMEHFKLDGDRCVPDSLEVGCPGNHYKIDETTNEVVCDCQANSTNDFWVYDMKGSCNLGETTCDADGIGRTQCAQRDATCHLNVNDINDYQCMCVVGKYFPDGFRKKTATELSKNSKLTCVNVCEMPHVENKCASIGAKCNPFKLWKRYIDNSTIEIDEKETFFCDCVPGTFFDERSKLCVQQPDTMSLQIEYLVSHNLENLILENINKYIQQSDDEKNIPNYSKFSNLEYLDPIGYGYSEMRNFDKNNEEENVFKVAMVETIKKEFALGQTKQLLHSFGKIDTYEDVQIISFRSNEDNKNLFSVDVAVKLKEANSFIYDEFDTDVKNFSNILHNCFPFEERCVIPYISVILKNKDTMNHEDFMPCEHWSTCNTLSNCIPHDGSYFSCECDKNFFNVSHRYTFNTRDNVPVLRNELCQSKMLCSDCLAKSANQDCIEEDPKSSATSKTWTKEAKCFCKSGFIRNSEEQCVSICSSELESCNEHGKCLQSDKQTSFCECDDGFYGHKCQWALMSNTGWIVAVVLLSLVVVLGFGTTYYFYKRSSSHSTSHSPHLILPQSRSHNDTFFTRNTNQIESSSSEHSRQIHLFEQHFHRNEDNMEQENSFEQTHTQTKRPQEHTKVVPTDSISNTPPSEDDNPVIVQNQIDLINQKTTQTSMIESIIVNSEKQTKPFSLSTTPAHQSTPIISRNRDILKDSQMNYQTAFQRQLTEVLAQIRRNSKSYNLNKVQ